MTNTSRALDRRIQPEPRKRLLTSFYDTGAGDASLHTYIPVDFQASPSDTTLAKIAVGIGAVIIIVRCKIMAYRLSHPTRQTIGAIIAIALACAPMINILSIITTTGADALSGDYVVHVESMARILSAGYSWVNIFRDSYYHGHLMLFPTVFRIVLAKTVYWNEYVELLCGYGVSVLSLFLTHNALTARSKHWFRIWMWPVLAVLVFSVNQINQFTFGDASIPMGFCALGIVLILWSMVRYRQRWAGTVLSVAAAWFASWSWGQGVAAWPLLLGAMVVVNLYKRKTLAAPGTTTHDAHRGSRYSPAQFAVVILSSIVALSPYLSLLLFSSSSDSDHVKALLNLQVIINGVGYAFVNGESANINIRAILGIETLFITGACVYLMLKGRLMCLLRAIGPGCYFASAGIASLWLLGMLRSNLSSWYTGIGLLFWLGYSGIVYAIFTTPIQPESRSVRSTVTVLRQVTGVATLIAAVVFCFSIVSYEDKVYFLFSRSPMTAACLRSGRSAPTFCEQYVILDETDGADHAYDLADQLKALRLSVFAPNQRWTLQGDYAFGNVTTREAPGLDRIRWLEDRANAPQPSYDYRHLNLFVPSPSAILWTIRLPDTTRKADFHTSVSLLSAAGASPVANPTVLISAYDAHGAKTALWSRAVKGTDAGSQPIDISLLPYAGQTITLELTSLPEPSVPGSPILFRYPFIDVLFDNTPAALSDVQNVMNPSPALSTEDAVFDSADRDQWISATLPLSASAAASEWSLEKNAVQSDYAISGGACLANYTMLTIRMSATNHVWPRMLNLSYELANDALSDPHNDVRKPIQIPLFTNEGMYEYTYPLRLSDFDPAARLSRLRLALSAWLTTTEKPLAHISDVRLIGRRPGNYCP